MMRVSTPSPLLFTPGGSLSQTKKPEALADSLGAQFQPVTVPLVPTVIETVDVALSRTYRPLPANQS